MVTPTTQAAETELIETGEKRDALGRRRTPEERRAELLAAYKDSGLTQSAFARREGISYTTFCSWAQRERGAGRLPTAKAGNPKRVVNQTKPVRFIEAMLPAMATAPAGLSVRLADGTELWGSNAKDLATLVRALRA